MKTNPNDSINARPYSHDERPSGGYEGDYPQTFQASDGLTKREYFAIIALQGILSAQTTTGYYEPTAAAIRAVCQADSLINALNK